jgi:probable F420-dependent oxidoreductase
VQIGVVFPQTEIGNDPLAIRDFAQAAEGLGYAHLLVYDHVLGAVGDNREPPLTGFYSEKAPFHEVFVLLGYLAGLTSRIELATGVLVLPQRQTALVAKQVAEVDILSGGRMRLGVGVGWNHVEYEALGEDFSNRGRRQEEQVEVMRRLWAEPVVDFTGRWHRIDRAGILPLPGRRIPVWFGGWTPPAHERAARLGDGFIVGFHGEPVPIIDAVRRQLDAAGRDPADFGIEVVTSHVLDPPRWVAHAEEIRDRGATHLTFRTMDAGFDGPSDHIEAIERYMKAVGDLT